jgi:tripartite-type tricarboxylate transporter receptor subunit TctC
MRCCTTTARTDASAAVKRSTRRASVTASRSSWGGFGAPKSTPAQIVERLNREINEALADPKVKSRLVDLGGTVLEGSATDFGKLIDEETKKWAKVIKFAGIKAE